MKQHIFFLLIILLFLSSCAGFSGGGEVQVFYLDKGKLQYFFPSTGWLPVEKDFMFEGDWLYRSFALESEAESRTIFNFTISYNKLETGARSFDTVYLISDDGRRTECRGTELLFKNHEKDRYTSWISSSDFSSFMMDNVNPALVIVMDDTEFIMYPSKEFNEHIHYFKMVQPEYR